ncbi:LLM class flavin-dependent oxidoreductase [Arthrobacter sp. zg-Y916]|uniref:LLM class flavin-dependent oxidoreductase n=1 Tax=Arthrobacter sp. zg-Y916 TaxID=2894190 RepID=UPI001E2C2265|nr:LLM class flavin-dependent oxidoreductase [Arthrobacter sp. zg-Y916]MCC9192144.1 LLM class flavin-dependent oxidoreductase [Arthrobacter sp. zg-Y916]
MPDYLHPLRFGSFITPLASAPQFPVDLALLSEELGLDLVTFQDHPYQPQFLDTWTLLSWVAARTSRIHVSGNVLNLPLRQPAVLARSLASLDRLSGGRVELGLGAGAYLEPMAAMGAPQLTAGNAVSGLEEALDIIRGIWDSENPERLRVDGQFHRVDGAKRGPAPAHNIPIWLGAQKPRMQRIIGRKGDGWLPSLPWLKPGDVDRGNQVIDESARKAGRDPRQITRLLNVTPQSSAEDLAELATGHGMSVFILASDDPEELRRFAETTAPRVRDRVAQTRIARARAGSPAPGEISNTVPGSTLVEPVPARTFQGESIPEALAARTLLPGDPGYARYTSSYFRGARPGVVVRPENPAEVQDAVRFAARHRDVPFGIFSAGHGLSGRSLNTGGIVLALDALNSITVRDGNRVQVGPGARWGEVAKALAPRGLAVTSGDYGGVGVGGLATTAGFGWFARERGLTIDYLRSVDVVTADGALVHASAEENSDLFWAVRGAGANFGAVVSFEFEAHPVAAQVGFAMLVFTPDDVAAFLEGWGSTIEAADPIVTGSLMVGLAGAGRPSAVQAVIVVDSSDPDAVLEQLQPFTGLAPLADQLVQMVPYAALMEVPLTGEGQSGRGEPHGHSGLVRHLDADVTRGLAGIMAADRPFFLSVRSAGGAVGSYPADSTAFGWREANFLISLLGGRSDDVQQLWRNLLPLMEGMYLSFETDTGPDVVARAFPPGHLRRLQALKAAWDPSGLFRDNFFIAPEPQPAGSSTGPGSVTAGSTSRGV